MTNKVNSNTLYVIWVVVILILLLVVARFFLDGAEGRASENVRDANSYLLEVRITYNLMSDMQMGVRGYILSENLDFLRPYNDARGRLVVVLRELEVDAARIDAGLQEDHVLPALVQNVVATANTWQRRVAEQSLMQLRSQGNDPALQTISADEAITLFDAFRAAIARVEAHVSEHIAAYERDLDLIVMWRGWILLGLGVLAFSSAVLAVRVARHDAALQVAALHAAGAETRRLQTIIDDLPVGVRLVSVPEGMIVLENRAASALFPADTWNNLKPEERASYFQYTRPDGTPVPYEQTPVVRTVREGISAKELEMKLTVPGVGSRTLIISTAPLVDEQGRMTAAVVVTQDVTRMKELDQRKDEFIATAAHELRNPLAAILGYTQLLQKQVPSTGTPTGVNTYLTAMDRQVRRLNNLVERLLDASRIQLGRLVLQKSRFNLADLAGAAASNIETGSGAQVRVKVQAPPEGAWGTWDVIRMEQVLTNLASNAARYSPPGADVEIRIENDEHEVRVQVVDRGPGVPPEQLPALFNRYYQGTNPTGPLAVGASSAQSNHKRGSLGLGLYISSEIVKAHGGAIGMEPNPEGGSIFWFTLPRDA